MGLFVSLAVAIYLWFDAKKHHNAILGVLFIVLGIFDQDREEGARLTILIFTILFYLMLLMSVLIGMLLFYQVSPS
nr:hypothetical protein [Bacillus pumilus]